MDFNDRITSDPKIMLGKPVIKETRIKVELILRKMIDGLTADKIIEMYPKLQSEDLLACLNHALEVNKKGETIKVAKPPDND